MLKRIQTTPATMEYINIEGDYLAAYHHCIEYGGQFFPSKNNDGANVVVIGNKCFTFWAKSSKTKVKCIELCSFFNVEPDNMTPGRLVRYFLGEVLELPYKNTFWSKNYRTLARQGEHWHHTKVIGKKAFDCIEIDLTSAYFSSLFSFPSLLYHPKSGYIDDGGSLQLLKEITPLLPKWFRLNFLGILAGWKHTYLCRAKDEHGGYKLVTKTRHHIAYNAAFNCAHRAVLRNYKIMQRIGKIGGDNIIRMHTDSFFMRTDTPKSIIAEIYYYLLEKAIPYKIKGCGRAFFWDLNTGFIGKKIIGAPAEVLFLMKRDGVKTKSKKHSIKCLSQITTTSSLLKDTPIEESLQLSLAL